MAAVQPPPISFARFAKDFFLAGVSAGVIALMRAPFERVRLLLQVQRSIIPSTSFEGIIDCVTRVYREQGFLSFWRGSLPIVVFRYWPTATLNFVLGRTVKDLFYSRLRTRSGWKFVLASIAAGSFSGFLGLCLVYPLDLARTRMAADVGSGLTREFTSLSHCLLSIIRSDGIFGLYNGFATSILGVVVYRATFFAIYDGLAGLVPRNVSPWKRILTNWAFAQTVTILSGAITYPIDTVRRRMMMQAGRAVVEYTGQWDCWRKIAATEGLQGFFSGYSAMLITAITMPIVLVFYEELQRAIFPSRPLPANPGNNADNIGA